MQKVFSEGMFKLAQPILAKIYQHPFVEELCAGTLPKEKFVYYMQQDSLYLLDYARALALIAAKSCGEKDISLSLDFASGALIAERSLHAEYFTEFDVRPVEQKMPACFSYTAHLLNVTGVNSLGEGMAALLPCFWIYNEVGKHILAKSSESNPYQKWIDTYSGDEFEKVTKEAIAYTDTLAGQTCGSLLQRMEEAFLLSCKMEYYFWDDAYNLRKWAV